MGKRDACSGAVATRSPCFSSNFHASFGLQGPRVTLTPSSSHHVFFFFCFVLSCFGFAAAILRDYTRMLSVYKSQEKSKVPIWRQYRVPPSSHALRHVPRAGRCLCTANPLFLFLFLLRSCVGVRAHGALLMHHAAFHVAKNSKPSR